jgi:hypothetical protein
MAWTEWKRPRNVVAMDDNEIIFSDSTGNLGIIKNLTSATPTVGVATSFGGIFTGDGEVSSNETQSLIFTDFGFNVDNNKVRGIRVKIHVSRLARIQDKIIQIWKNGKPAGKNRANLDAEDVQIYGGEDDLWGTQRTDFNNEKFGVIADFQPHTQYPSNNTVYFRYVYMSLYIED